MNKRGRLGGWHGGRELVSGKTQSAEMSENNGTYDDTTPLETSASGFDPWPNELAD